MLRGLFFLATMVDRDNKTKVGAISGRSSPYMLP
jgi:hypothetical protein